MRKLRRLALGLAAASLCWAGAADFGQQEFERALAERKLSPQRFRIQTEVSTDPPECFRILPGRVSGGDIRGLMYGLLEAAEQIRSRGWLIAAKGAPATAIRGVRLAVQAEDLDKDWFGSRERWEELFATLARSRFNRLNLAFDGSAITGERVLAALRLISQVASGYAVDLAVSIGPEAVSGAGLKALLAACPAVRSVQVQPGAGGANDTAASRCDVLVGAVSEAGRRVTIEFPPQELTPAVEVKAAGAGVPLRIPVKYGSPALPERPGGAEMIWQIAPAAAAEPGQWNDPAFVRKTVQDMIRPGFAGFEIDAPEPPASGANQAFYMLWGRLSYDPKTPESLFPGKAEKRP